MFFVWLLIVFCCFGVILRKNPVYSLLSLVAVFILVGIMFMSLGLELIGMLTMFMYVGAISIIFLFILMFIEVPYLEFKSETDIVKSQQFVFSFLIFSLLRWVGWYSDIGLAFSYEFKALLNAENLMLNSNVYQLGNLFYSEFGLGFLLCGLILLVAMISVILISSLL